MYSRDIVEVLEIMLFVFVIWQTGCFVDIVSRAHASSKGR